MNDFYLVEHFFLVVHLASLFILYKVDRYCWPEWEIDYEKNRRFSGRGEMFVLEFN